jgi:vancomycin resistance protein YoaR
MTPAFVVCLIAFSAAFAQTSRTKPVPPARFPFLLARYTTAFEEGEIERNTNIKLAARRINGQIIAPREEFSFNRAVGPRETETSDFEAAPVLTSKGKMLGLGGGICQVAGTLYNAALLANLGIMERHPHSQVVRYLPPGRDATVAQDGTDLVLKNTSEQPVRLKAEVRDNHLTFSFWSPQPKKSEVQIVTTSRPAGIPGYRVGVITERVVVREGKIVRRERLSEDRYRGRL